MKPVIAIHGGAGVMRRDEPGAAHRAVLEEALEAGYDILRANGSSLDAVAAAVVVLEDSPLFNAGRGSCFTADGEIEMDASIMDGATLRAGAVAAVRRIRNPILAARLVMEKTRHVLLAGAGAERFARQQGLRLESQSYFRTAKRLAALRKNLKDYHGTVGAVALDSDGRLAAATSTGGYTGKMPGRVGDSPLIGAGTYADDRACAVSGTGLGEAFIRAAVGHDVCARMLYAKVSLASAARAALESVANVGGDGGLIAVDRRGNVAMPFNSEGMFRACIDRRGRRSLAIF
ncbi:MAG TPA: isoaspartyl peptidase/L-asparaginase [Burkholderiales bacterium]|nr:isoaspartyl peptidase/L-asparaginase [Burkholderiales bacterium]